MAGAIQIWLEIFRQLVDWCFDFYVLKPCDNTDKLISLSAKVDITSSQSGPKSVYLLWVEVHIFWQRLSAVTLVTNYGVFSSHELVGWIMSWILTLGQPMVLNFEAWHTFPRLGDGQGGLLNQIQKAVTMRNMEYRMIWSYTKEMGFSVKSFYQSLDSIRGRISS